MRATWVLVAAALAASGCSIVNDSSAHTGPASGMDAGPGSPEAGTGPDAGDPIEDAGTDAGPPPMVPSNEYCARFAAALCEAAPRCCSTEDPAAQNCEMTVEDVCLSNLQPVFFNSAVVYDPVEAARSLDDGFALLDACATVDGLDWLSSRDGILRPFRGTVRTAQSCEDMFGDDEQIVSVVICEDPELVCRGPAGARTCTSKVPEDGPCEFRAQCEGDQRCIAPGGASLMDKSCSTTGEPVGSHCWLDDECESLNCTNIFLGGECAPAEVDDIYCIFTAPADGG